MTIDRTFLHKYDFEILREIAGDPIERFYFPSGSSIGGYDGLMLRVMPENASSWIGIFEFGDMLDHGLTGVYTLPDDSAFCVISNGSGYVVQSQTPDRCIPIQHSPVILALPLVEHQLLILATPWEVLAYGKN